MLSYTDTVLHRQHDFLFFQQGSNPPNSAAMSLPRLMMDTMLNLEKKKKKKREQKPFS